MKYESWSVRQLTNRKGKPWQARLKYKDVATGKWKETSKVLKEATGVREAKKLAEAWFDEMNAAAANSPNIELDKTVGEMVLDYVEFQKNNGKIELSTYRQQTTTYKNYVRDYIGDFSFATLDRTAISIWLTKLNARGLAQSTIGRGYNLVKKVYDYYYKIGELNKNPFLGITPPKQGKPKITHLTKEQSDNYLAAVYADYEPSEPFYIAALLLYYAGLRRGEVCGLRWRDVDLKEGTISVETAISIGEKGKPYSK